MQIEEVTDLTRDQWFQKEVSSKWNGRDVIYDLKEAGKISDISNIWLLTKESTSQNIGGSASTEVDSQSGSSSKVEGHYTYQSYDDKGRSDSVRVQGEASIDDRGNTNAKATVSYDINF